MAQGACGRALGFPLRLPQPAAAPRCLPVSESPPSFGAGVSALGARRGPALGGGPTRRQRSWVTSAAAIIVPKPVLELLGNAWASSERPCPALAGSQRRL